MLDKVVKISDKELMLIYTDREAMILYSSKGNVLAMLDEFLAPMNTQCITLSAYLRGNEDTIEIELEKVGA